MAVVFDVAGLSIDSWLTPLNLTIRSGETVVLVCPEADGARKLLHLLAHGSSGTGRQPRIVGIGPKHRASSVGPDLAPASAEVLLVEPYVDLLDDTERETLSPILSRAKVAGAAVVFASSASCYDLPFERAVPALWTPGQLRSELALLRARAHVRVSEVLDLVDTDDRRRAAAVAVELRRIRMLAKALVDRLHESATTPEERITAKHLAGEMESTFLSDRLLERIASGSKLGS